MNLHLIQDDELLNITTMTQIIQLQSNLPEFLKKQLALIESTWPQYQRCLADDAAAGRYEAMADTLHKIKGHAGMLGLHAVYQRAADLEAIYRLMRSTGVDHQQDLKSLDQLFYDSLNAADRAILTICS